VTVSSPLAKRSRSAWLTREVEAERLAGEAGEARLLRFRIDARRLDEIL
jgi:hypothetical protein